MTQFVVSTPAALPQGLEVNAEISAEKPCHVLTLESKKHLRATHKCHVGVGDLLDLPRVHKEFCFRQQCLLAIGV